MCIYIYMKFVHIFWPICTSCHDSSGPVPSLPYSFGHALNEVSQVSSPWVHAVHPSAHNPSLGYRISQCDVLHVTLLHLMEKLPLKWSSNRLGWLSSNYPLTNQDQPSLCRSYHPPQPTAAHLVGMEEAGLDDRPPHPPIFDLGVAEISAAVLMKKMMCLFIAYVFVGTYLYSNYTHLNTHTLTHT